ncbi:Rep protein, partial [Pseudomonas aeruginosa]|uniref:protein rep n=1 Tax=Pseudomonas aeruginosa TaxID=287 RepID=UPI001C6104DC|nr:Rep protein [Pseudomonas aeruginosa]
TLTVTNGLGDDLTTLHVQIRNAWRRTTTGRAVKDFRKLLGIKCTIRALEVTHGQNGFQPHLHVLLFLEQDATNG